MTNLPKNEKGYQLRSGLFILPEQDREMSRLVTELQRSLPARFVMLVDVAGQVIMIKGEHGNVDPVMLGSLVAGDLAASQEIARLIGEYQDYQLILREGQHSHTFIIEAGHYLALLVQVDKETPLGWARMFIIKTAQQLAKIADQAIPTATEMNDIKQEMVLAMDESEESLADLFGNALDEMWSN